MKVASTGERSRRGEDVFDGRNKQHGVFGEGSGETLWMNVGHQAEALCALRAFGFCQGVQRAAAKGLNRGITGLDFCFGKGTLTSVWRMDFNQGFSFFYSFPVEKRYNKIEWFTDQ